MDPFGTGGSDPTGGPLSGINFASALAQPTQSALGANMDSALGPAPGPALLKGGLAALLKRQGASSKTNPSPLISLLSTWLGGTGGGQEDYQSLVPQRYISQPTGGTL